MTIVKPSRSQYYSWWLLMPIIAFSITYILYGQRIFNDWSVIAISFPIIYTLGYASWYLHIQYNTFITSRFPSLQQTKQRALFKIAVNLVIMTPTILVGFYLFHVLHILGYTLQENDLKYGYLVGLIVNIILESLQEVIYLLTKYKENVAEEELLKQMQLEQEFENLKQKMNPHFLFNCFNTLLYLITDNRVKAEMFLDELSKAYRYLLRNNEYDISTVEQEVTFIQSYASLLKTRFGEGFLLQVAIAENIKALKLPSLTLQLLVENAVKHNVVSEKRPISVLIYSINDNTLIVENTLSKKPSHVISTGIGLSSIKEKYRLLQYETIQIEETSTHFRVKLPLLQEQYITMQ